MKPYCTKDNILVTEGTLELFKKTVFSIPFDETASGYYKQRYYRSVTLFLQHLICSATVSQNSKNKARFKENEKWTYSVPFPYELGVKVCPEVFKASRDLGYERALEKLIEAKIIKMIEKFRVKKLCREFALSKIFLKRLFPEDRKSYLKRDDRYTYLTNVFGKRNTEGTLEQFFNQRKGLLGIPKHETTKRDIPSDELRSTVKTVYSQLEPLYINIYKLIKFRQKNPTIENIGYYTRFISHLYEVGVEVISSQPLVVAYRQA
ncbi:hypothetical protein [Pectobacterium parvum]|uniref:hypothetical protein n=1 Tax=Pectobacterium parvum TaxID=2778550 RepID=UPI003804ECE8